MSIAHLYPQDTPESVVCQLYCFPPLIPNASGEPVSFVWEYFGAGKRSETLGPADEPSRARLRELVARANVLITDRPAAWLCDAALDHATLAAVAPGLVTVWITPFGADGPYAGYAGSDLVVQALSGMLSLSGEPGRMPLKVAANVQVALAHRGRSGEGQRIDGSMFEAAVGYIGEEILLAATGVPVPHPRGNRDRAVAPQGVFSCAGDDEWLALTVRDDADWRALLGTAADAPWLRDPRYESVAGRLTSVGELEEAVARWTRRHDARRLMTSLQRASVPAGVVLKTDEVPHDPHFVARGWFRPLTHPDTGTQAHNGYPWRFSRSPLVWRSASLRLGQHSREVLGGLLGMADGDLDELRAAGAVAEAPTV